jgi:hypothetical protein
MGWERLHRIKIHARFADAPGSPGLRRKRQPTVGRLSVAS